MKNWIFLVFLILIMASQGFSQGDVDIFEQKRFLSDSIIVDSIPKISLDLHRVLIDSLNVEIEIKSDSVKLLKLSIEQDRQFASSLLYRIDTLNDKLLQCESLTDTLLSKHDILMPENKRLKTQVERLQGQVEEQDSLLTKQTQLLVQKEVINKEKEDIYKDALLGTKIDLVKLEGEINAKEKELAGKTREIDLMSQSIQEKQRDIEHKNNEITKIAERRELANRMIDSLKDSLAITQQKNITLYQEKKYVSIELASLKAKLEARDKKTKQVAIVQGVAMRSFRTPLYILAPKDVNNIDSYEIANENAGGIEFDLITGASVRIFKLSKETDKYNSDFGWFVGFGGKNLFKNFYFGPNIKLFDFFHINAGLNVAEFRVLKSGFNEGDILSVGTPIPTVNQWKFNMYFALTIDFEIITQIAGKL
ncbi:MAG: hypothetical protein PHU27_02865 [Salinivirgaceae bacterium]|nr:hypothetical protein [Salinivirgaceae bacterium]MDD4748236.1 hypothetical protein [Salinivirgaceae bacterium]